MCLKLIGNQGPQVICEFEECQTTGNKPGSYIEKCRKPFVWSTTKICFIGKLAYCSLVQLEGSESVLFGGYDESCIENNDIYILKSNFASIIILK